MTLRDNFAAFVAASNVFLSENGRRFFLIIGGLMVMGTVLGLERSLLPLMAEPVWGQSSYKGKLWFIVSFGISKAIFNLIAGQINDRFGRKASLIAGFVLGLPVSIIFIFAQSWTIVIFTNVLFGFSQGFIGSGLIVMMMDIFGTARKGTAVGIAECTIYTTVAIVSAIAVKVADKIGYRPWPFVFGAIVSAIGVVIASIIKDTMDKVNEQAKAAAAPREDDALLLSSDGRANDAVVASAALAELRPKPSPLEVLKSLLANGNYMLICLCGMMDKAKDGFCWGLFPLWFKDEVNLRVSIVSWLLSVYPITWGVTQLFTGGGSDRFGRKIFLWGGFAVNSLSLLVIVGAPNLFKSEDVHITLWFLACFTLGIGTALIYPTMQAAATDEAAPEFRASSLGVYKFTRDIGYAVGALLSGTLADEFGLHWTFVVIAGMLLCVAVLVAACYRNRRISKKEAPATIKA
eukprot:c4744_g1_i2.p1 GENE.c4744_g1_i2~~c4744_g1_i2.p1  ORF type:complete len:462 (+),score=83.47 c4744_g1_i2:108-1493(+)